MTTYTVDHRRHRTAPAALPPYVISIGERILTMLGEPDSDKRLYRDRLNEFVRFWELQGNYDIERYRTFLNKYDSSTRL